LSGYFSGGWLSFLEFTGEQPHADEEVVTGLPDAKLHPWEKALRDAAYRAIAR
jgi:hypothetical protein